METGSELSKTVAIFIVQKILLDDMGLQYICQTYERFYAVGTVLSNMVTQLVDQQTVRLLKHVVRCFLRYAYRFSYSARLIALTCSQTFRQCARTRSSTAMPPRAPSRRDVLAGLAR